MVDSCSREALRRVLDDLDEWLQLVWLELIHDLFGLPVSQRSDSTGISLRRMPLARYLDSPMFEIGYFRLRGFSRMQLLFGLPTA
jgi:hypothetical protein